MNRSRSRDRRDVGDRQRGLCQQDPGARCDATEDHHGPSLRELGERPVPLPHLVRVDRAVGEVDRHAVSVRLVRGQPSDHRPHFAVGPPSGKRAPQKRHCLSCVRENRHGFEPTEVAPAPTLSARRRTAWHDRQVHPDKPGRKRAPAVPEHAGVSFVMPVLNERAYLERAVETVLAQHVDGPMELVLALGPSTDGTNELAARARRARQPRRARGQPRGRHPDRPQRGDPRRHAPHDHPRRRALRARGPTTPGARWRHSTAPGRRTSAG